jgi:hypothetical protein
MRSRGRDNQQERGYHGPERRVRDTADDVEPVILTRKLAEVVDGINLVGREVGDRLPLSSREADMLIAEGWAQPIPAEQRRRDSAEDDREDWRQRTA